MSLRICKRAALWVGSGRIREVTRATDYHERLALLGLESLELRRHQADLCMTYKIMFNLVDLNVDNFLITRGHPYTLVKPLCQVRARNNFLACRVIDPWNYLDAKSNSFKSLNAFKNFLGVCDLSNFLVYK